MGFFPCNASSRIMVKSLLILTCYYSMSWHWFNIGFSLPGDKDMYRILDAVFSIVTIISYSLSWIPKCGQNNDLKLKNDFWHKHFLGPPRETSEWSCRNIYTNYMLLGFYYNCCTFCVISII